MSLLHSVRSLGRLLGNRSRSRTPRNERIRSLRFEPLEPRHLLSVTVWLHYLPDFKTDLNVACQKAGVDAFSDNEIASIKDHIEVDVVALFCEVPGLVVFSDEEPQGIHETIEFGGSGDDLGSAPWDWRNLTAGQTAKVYPENFYSVIKAADEAAASAEERNQLTAQALANVAAHELGHTFGLGHFNCYGDPGIDPEDTDSDYDQVGDQNQYVMSTAITGKPDEFWISESSFSPMSFEVLEFAANLGGRGPEQEQATDYGAHDSAASSESLKLNHNGGSVVMSGEIKVSQEVAEKDYYALAGREGDLLTVLIAPTTGVDFGLQVADAQGGSLSEQALRGQVWTEGNGVAFDAFGDDFTFGQDSSSEDLSLALTPMLLNIRVPATALYHVVVSCDGVCGGYDLFAWLVPDHEPPETPDIAITGFRADGQNMLVDYEISTDLVDEFNVGIHRSANGSTLDARLMYQRLEHPALLVPGNHTVTVIPDFNDVQQDYYLLAKVDDSSEVAESNENNNVHSFAGGVFLDSTRKVVHVHGTDPVADAVDVVLSGNQLEVWLNGQPFSYPEADVSQVHVRTHDGADSITASVSKPIWGFGGDDDDQLRGGYGNDYLRGGSGNDTYRFAGSADLGSDTVAEWLQGSPEGGTDTLDFSELAYAVSVNLANTGSQAVAPNLRLTLTDDYGMENVVGTPFGDVLRGNSRNNWMYCGDGNDTAYGGYGNDTIYGYGGIDQVFGELGNDYLNGGAGNDYLDSGYGLDLLFGADGDDYLNVYDGYGGDYAYGDSGDDTGYGDPDGYGGSSDNLFVEHPYPPGGGGGDSLPGGGDPLLTGPADTSAEELLYGGLQDAETLRRWRELLWFYTEWQKKRRA